MSMNNALVRRKGLLFVWLVFCITPVLLHAQQTTGDILGAVTDPTGATVPGTTVSVENLGTHEKRIVSTSSTGEYVVNLLPPGSYSVTATASGFKTFFVPSLALAAGDRARVDAHVTPGDVSDTVTVEAAASELKTDSSVLSNTIDQKATQDTPLNGRDFVQLIQLTPGANEGPPKGLTNGGGLDDRRQTASVSINGQSDILNNEMIDGADNNERLIGTIAVRPSIDAISEISVQSNTYTAEVGRTGGGIVNVITKSGTDKFHGDLFEFFRNDALNAHTFNFGASLPKAELRQNQYGGSIGGPIVKDRTFFFGAYEAYRTVQATAPMQVTVPTLFEEQNPGNFSDTGGGVLTPAQLDRVGLDYFSMYPAPNSGTNHFIGSSKNVQYSTDYDARADHTFNSTNLMYGRFIYNNVYTDSPGIFPNVTVAGINLNPNWLGYGLGNARDVAFDGLLNYIHIFNSKLVLELKASYTRVNNQSNPETDGQNPNQAFGQPNVNTPISDSTGLAPVVVAQGADLGSVYFQPLKDQDNTFQYLGALTNTVGNHNIKIGGGVIRRQLTSFQSGEPEGLWVFLNYSGLLQGEYLSTARSLQLYTPHLETWEPSVYAQDDWRFSKTLTVNLGLRYDIYTPYTETRNHISTFNAANGSLLVAGQGGVSNTAGVQTDHMGFAPRLGFAFSPGKEFVIRGGYGIGYFPANTTSNANLKNPPFVATVSTCSYLSCGPGFTRFANGLPVPTPTSIGSPGASIPDATATNFKTSYIQQFNLTTQKNVTGNVITLTYVGLLGRQLAQLRPDLNAPPPNTCGTNASCYNALRPYFAVDPNLGQVGYLQTGGSSSYNAFEASVERRLSHGATANINYQFAHALDNSEAFLAGGAAADGFGTVPSRVSS